MDFNIENYYFLTADRKAHDGKKNYIRRTYFVSFDGKLGRVICSFTGANLSKRNDLGILSSGYPGCRAMLDINGKIVLECSLEGWGSSFAYFGKKVERAIFFYSRNVCSKPADK